MIDREDNFDIERNSGVPNLIDTLTCDFENGFHNDEKVKLKRKTRIIPDPVIISQTELSQAASNSSQSPFKIDIYDGHLPDALFLTEQSTGSMQYIHDDAQNWKSPRGILSNIFTSKQALPKRQIFSNPASTKHNLFEVHLVSPSHSVPTHSVMFDIPEDSSINNINNVEKPSIPTSATRNHFTSSIFSRLRTPTSPYNFDTNSSSPRNKDEVDSASPNDSHSNYNSQNDSPQAPAHPDIMIFENVRRNCIRVMNEGFQTHVINVSSLTDVSQVIELIHQKFRLQNNLKNDYAIYLRESDNLNEARKITNEELWAICSGCNSYARSNLLLKKVYQNDDAVATNFPTRRSTKISSYSGRYSHNRSSAVSTHSSLNERPSSDIVSLNFGLFFPKDVSESISATPVELERQSTLRSNRVKRHELKRVKTLVQRRMNNETQSQKTTKRMSLQAFDSSANVDFLKDAQIENFDEPKIPNISRKQSLASSCVSSKKVIRRYSYSSVADQNHIPSQDNLIKRPSSTLETGTEYHTIDNKVHLNVDSDFDSLLANLPPSPDVIPTHDFDDDIPPSPTTIPTDSESDENNENFIPIPSTDSSHDTADEWIKGDLIGHGSFAKVYYGVNSRTGQIMAVKQVQIPKPISLNNVHPLQRESIASIYDKRKRMVDALESEIQILKELKHDNIVSYYGSLSDSSYLNVFLEYVGGGSIASILARDGFIIYPKARSYTKQLVNGLEYLHSKGIIHRDIKGANILVTQDNIIKISDFGVAKWMSSLVTQRRFSVQGSIFWMAPEVIRRENFTFKADVWSLGCLVIEMMTGNIPWDGIDQVQSIIKLGHGMSPVSHLQNKRFSPVSPCRSSFRGLNEISRRVSVARSAISDNDQDCDIFDSLDTLINNGKMSCSWDILPLDSKYFIESCLTVDVDIRPSMEELKHFHFVELEN